MATSYTPGVQKTVSSFELSMPSVSHPAVTKVMISTPLKTSLKRPRLELEEEETLPESTFTAQDSDVTVKEFSFMDSNQTVRHRFRCMYYMFSSRS